jgi:hypothetical protein
MFLSVNGVNSYLIPLSDYPYAKIAPVLHEEFGGRLIKMRTMVRYSSEHEPCQNANPYQGMTIDQCGPCATRYTEVQS